jgi:MFS family permease
MGGTEDQHELFLTDFSDGYVDAKGKPALTPALLGFVASCYQLGSILGVPVAPWFNHRFGRRWCIMIGSLIMVVGAIIQGFSQHGQSRKPTPISILEC